METVKNWAEIEKNIIEFNLNLNNGGSKARKRFAMFSHWYYDPSTKFFGPSKFIGYQNTTHANYKGEGSGGITQKVLAAFFKRIVDKSEKHQLYLEKLLMFASENNLRISKKTLSEKYGGIYIPK
jgi:hypothetical protein